MRAWIGIALLAASWLLGVNFYDLANFPAWIALVAAGTLLLAVHGDCPDFCEAKMGLSPLAEGDRHIFLPEGRKMSQSPAPIGQTLAALALLAPAICIAPWPYAVGPLLLAAGLAVSLLPTAWSWLKSLGLAAVTAGLVLVVQGAAVGLYIAQTARWHDAPWPIPDLLAALAGLFGIDATATGPYVVLHTMRQTHRLAITWDMVLDPATLSFFLGGLAMLAWTAWSALPGPRRWGAWLRAAGGLALVVILWLPLRSLLLTAIYLHRVERFNYDWPLHTMNHFFSAWVSLLLLAAPAILAWRLVRLRGAAETEHVESHEPAARRHRWGSWRLPASVALALLGGAVLAGAMVWSPVGSRKAGRVQWVERHSIWSPTTHPYDTKSYGEREGGYNYAAAYRWLGQFYQMSQLLESDPIDDATLARCDVLVIKIPNIRYSKDEVEAIVRFLRAGGGLLLIGDHTNLDRSSAYMNDITRSFGFTFRDDLLFGSESSPFEEHHETPHAPHPAAQHLPWFDFAVSCSIDPGWSQGRPVVVETGLWSMTSDYHMSNYHPYPQHCPEMRYGAFIEAWAARCGQGRAIAFGDSTIFSNFCLFQPGKSELLANMIEWLNHENPPLDPALPLGALAVALLAVGLRLGAAAGLSLGATAGLSLGATAGLSSSAENTPRGTGLSPVQKRKSRQAGRPALPARGKHMRAIENPLLLLAAGLCGWWSGTAAAAAVNRAALPLPTAVRPELRVVIDRTTSQVPLARGAYNEDEHGFGLLEQWIPRLGYYTTRAAGPEEFCGDALVVICPSRPASKAFSDRLLKYVADGGKLLVIDSPENTASTADEVLRPFGLSVLRGHPCRGALEVAGAWPAIAVEQAWEITGGRPVARLGRRTVAATATYGKGQVMALGFGSWLDDANMGHSWMEEPDGEMLLRYQTLFALVQSLVEGKPIAAPASPAGEHRRTTEPKASAIKRPGGRMPH